MLFLCDTAILLQSTEKLILYSSGVSLISKLASQQKLIKLLCFMSQISILTRCPQVLRKPSDLLSNSCVKRLSKFRKQGSRNLPLPGALLPWAPLSSPYPILNPRVSFYGLKKLFLFIWLRCVLFAAHTGSCSSLLIWDPVPQSGETKTRTPCIGSTES